MSLIAEIIENPDHPKKELIQSSFASVAPIAEQAADIFYNKLFELDPALKALFKSDLKEQGRKLMAMIGTAVNGLNRPQSIIGAVQDLGKRHVGYGVQDTHYDTVASALLYTLEVGLGNLWTEELKEAWTALYIDLATTMKEAASATA